MNPNTNQEHESELRRSQQQRQSRAAFRSSPAGERPVVQEQQPIMRSVAISPSTQHQRTLQFEPALQSVNPGAFGHLPPLRGVSEPGLIESNRHILKSAPLPSQKLPPRSKSESAIFRKWPLVELTNRPTDFPPLRTTRTVHSTPANLISNRISDCLQSRSIKTRFSKSEINLAKCRNTDFCKFTIRLYLGEDGGVMIEIQRLCGDCMSFMKDCRAIWNAAEGKTDDSQADEKPLFLRLPVSEMAFMKRASMPPVTQEEEADSLNVTANLLSSCQSDSNMLGMESLVIDTDPLKTLKSTAILASRRILCVDDPGNTSFNMHNYVMSHILYGNNEEVHSASSVDSTPLEDHSMKLRNLAMSALVNALTLFSSENLLLKSIASNQEWFTSVLIPKLLQDLSTAEHHPHDACYATRCLSILAESSVEFANKMQEEGGYDALKNAQDVGMREFALLARDADSCHKILSCCV
ncbi:hypothetical protein ACHAXR_009631 [Thalassiosira sp. AJA248-18]